MRQFLQAKFKSFNFPDSNYQHDTSNWVEGALVWSTSSRETLNEVEELSSGIWNGDDVEYNDVNVSHFNSAIPQYGDWATHLLLLSPLLRRNKFLPL